MSIYINQLTQQLNLQNIFDSTAHLNSYPLTAKLKLLFATQSAIHYLNRYPLPKQLILSNMTLSFLIYNHKWYICPGKEA